MATRSVTKLFLTPNDLKTSLWLPKKSKGLLRATDIAIATSRSKRSS